MLTPGIPEGFLPLTPAETSCVIANLFIQLEPPCPVGRPMGSRSSRKCRY